MRAKRNKFTEAVLVLCALCCFFLNNSAQENVSISAKVSAVLAKFPAENSKDRDLLAAELAALGSDGIREVCRRLAARGTDDDSLSRFALDALAVYATRPGAEAERRMFTKELLKNLDVPREAEIKTFLLSQLQLTGRDEIVKPLGKFLRDPVLCGPAARALSAVRTPRAESVLLKALDSASPETAAALIQALGELKSKAAAKKISLFAVGENEKLRPAALSALAAIGDPASQPVLEKMAVAASPYERARAASLYLHYAERLWESGKKELSERICRDFVKNYTLPGESQVRASALTTLVRILGPGVFEILLEAVDSPDGPFRERALELADSIPGDKATSRWVEKMRHVSPDAQAAIIAMLGRRGDPAALSAVRERIKSEDKAVRLAAIAAAGRLGGENVLEDIWPLIQTDDEDQLKAVKQTLLIFPSGRIVARAAASLSDAPPRARIALIEILAERRAKEYAGQILAQARSENDAVRKAALAALEQVVRPEDVLSVIDLILKASAAPEVTLIQNALVAASNQITEPEKRADKILAAFEKSQGPKRADLIRPLARIGGTRALAVVVSETKSRDPQTQAAAVYTLANWTEASALEELFRLARGATDRRSRYLALQGIARLAGNEALSSEESLTRLKDALEIAIDPAEKILVISGLGGLRTPESLKAAAKFLESPAFQTRAAQAILRMALPSPGFEGLSGFETAMILKKTLLFIDDDYDRDQAEKYARALLLREGFSLLFNGKDLAGWKGLVADPPKRAKMTPAELAEAQREADGLMRRHWKVMDGVLVFDGKGHSLCTLKDCSDFEMFVDWRIGPKGDSGLYLRGSPQVQIWDPAQGPEGSGGLYNNKTNPSKPLVKADRPVGEWNTFYLKMVGERVTVYLNGLLVADNVVLENYWERDKPIYPAGQIELQAHSTPLSFKNIYIRELPSKREEAK